MAEAEQDNDHRFQLFIRILLSLSNRERLSKLFTEEVAYILADESRAAETATTHGEMVNLIMVLDQEYIIKWSKYNIHLFRDVGRCKKFGGYDTRFL